MSYRSIAAALAAMALLVASTSVVDAQSTTTTRDAHQSNRANSMQGKTVRASEIIGMNVYNPQGEDLAEINDVVLDPNTGKVRYAAVTYGGVLGIGDEMFAVPWEAFECTVDPDDPDDHRLTLDVSKQQLEGAQGFNQDNWPNFADPNFTNELDNRYRVKRDRNGNVNIDVNRDGLNVGVNRQNRTQ